MALYLEEFLYRGRPPGAEQPPAYHVILGDVTEDVFGQRAVSMSPAMTPAQAEAAGFPLVSVLEGINGTSLAENAELRTTAATLTKEKAAWEEERVVLKAEIERLLALVPPPEKPAEQPRRPWPRKSTGRRPARSDQESAG